MGLDTNFRGKGWAFATIPEHSGTTELEPARRLSEEAISAALSIVGRLSLSKQVRRVTYRNVAFVGKRHDVC